MRRAQDRYPGWETYRRRRLIGDLLWFATGVAASIVVAFLFYL